MSDSDAVRASKVTRNGGIITAVIAGVFVVMAASITADATQGDNPPPPPSSSSALTSPPGTSASTTTTTATTTPPSELDIGRTHFHIPLGEFTLDGDVVVKYDGQVGASGFVNPKGAAKAEKCRFVFMFEPINKAGEPVGATQFRRCEPDGPEQDFPGFGPVWFDNDKNIAYVKVTAYLDGRAAPEQYCQLMDNVCDDSPPSR